MHASVGGVVCFLFAGARGAGEGDHPVQDQERQQGHIEDAHDVSAPSMTCISAIAMTERRSPACQSADKRE